MRQFRTTMEMWWAVEWYRDVLFHAEYGAMINSGAFTGTPGDVAKQQVTEWLAEQGMGKAAVNYRLRDWLISRQRYWGAPIPMIYCPSVRHRAGALRGPAGAAARRRRVPADRRERR